MNSPTQSIWTSWSLNRFTLALSLVAYLTLLIFGGADFKLDQADQFLIGQASQQGVDVSGRVSTYFKSILFLAIGFLLAYRWLFNWVDHCNARFQSDVIRPLALGNLVLVLANVMGVENDALVHHLFYLILILLVVELLASAFRMFKLLLNPTVLMWSASTAVLGSLLVLFLFNSKQVVWTQGFTVFMLLFGLNLTVVLLSNRFKIELKRLINWLAPLCILPFLVLFVVELNIWSFNRFGDFLPYKWIAVSILAVVLIGWFAWTKKSNSYKSAHLLLTSVYLPGVLIGLVLFAFYAPFQEPASEMFEMANPANAQMRFWWFGEWPFLDYMSSHLLSEQWFGFLFHQFHGYDGSLSFLSFDFFNLVLVFVLGYWFLRRTLSNSFVAFLTLLLLPFPFVFLCRPLAVVLVVYLFFDKCRTQPKWYLCLYAVGFALLSFFWRLDVGISVLYTALVFVPLVLIKEQNRLLTKHLLKSLVICFAGFGLVVAVFGLIFSFEYLRINFVDALNYVSGSQAHGYSTIVDVDSNGFFIMYIMMPFLAVLGVLYGCWRYFSNHENWTVRYAPGLAGVFLLLIYLVNMPRGLVRHGLVEGHDSFLTATFYLGVSLIVWASVKGKIKIGGFEIVFASAFLLITLFKVFPWPKHHQLVNNALVNSSLANLDLAFQPNNPTDRYRVNQTTNPFTELRDFLDNQVYPNQTIFDFSNTPMLYHYLKRAVPSFFCQPLQNTITDWQQLNQLNKWNTTLVPAVVYANCPRTWFDQTDGVPNALRQYLLVEKIYRDYRPFGVLDGKSVWLDKKIQLSNESFEKDTLLDVPQVHEYGRMAELWAGKIAEQLGSNEDVGVAGQLKHKKVGEGGNRILFPNKNPISGDGHFLRLTIKSTGEGVGTGVLAMKQGETVVGTNTFLTTPGTKDYLLRLSNHYIYHIQGASFFDLQLNEQDKLLSVELIFDRRHANR